MAGLSRMLSGRAGSAPAAARHFGDAEAFAAETVAAVEEQDASVQLEGLGRRHHLRIPARRRDVDSHLGVVAHPVDQFVGAVRELGL